MTELAGTHATSVCEPVVDVTRNEVHWGGEVWRFGHALGALFVRALWQASLAGQVLSPSVWHSLCMAAKVRTLPNRKSMARLVAAVNDVFTKWPTPHAPRLCTRPRGHTVGPWWWVLDPGSCWLAGSPNGQGGLHVPHSGRPFDQPGLGSQPATVARTVMTLLHADANLWLGKHYTRVEAAMFTVLPIGQGQWPQGLSPDWVCLLGMRWLQVKRRLHTLQDSDVTEWMQWVEPRLQHLHPLWLPHVRQHFALTRARAAYDDTPAETGTHHLIHQLDAAGGGATDALHLTDLCNQKALLARREAVQNKPNAGNDHATNQWEQADAWHQAAYFWACAAQHPYLCQATAVNYAYFWQCRWEQGDESALEQALNWYHMGEEWCRRTHLQHDSAWDFVMFGSLYRQAYSTNAPGLHNFYLGWPAELDPAQSAYWERMLAVAHETGSVRQKELSYDLALWFYTHVAPHAQRAQQVEALAAALAVQKNLVTNNAETQRRQT